VEDRRDERDEDQIEGDAELDHDGRATGQFER
jgi:hypothetical protein